MDWLLPESLTTISALVLIVSACFTSFISASMGIGGGLLLLLIMANVVPVSILIPLHGLVQLGSNANRMVMTRHAIQWPIVVYFALGAVIGVLIAALVLVQVPLAFIQLTIASFVLFMIWGIKPKKRDLPKPLRIFAGAVTSFLSMFVGATGPLVAAIIYNQRVDKHQIVASFSTCMTVQHGLKIVVFSVMGFSFSSYLPIIILMILAGTVGTWLGLKLLNKLQAKYFTWLFKASLTILALRTFYLGVNSLI